MASKRAKAALASGLGLVALTATYLTAPWEGMENQAYYDKLGKVWTVCLGETKDVKKGDYYTDKQCREKLITRLENDFRQPLRKCIRTFDQAPISVQASMLDLSYNIGTGAACKSTAARRMSERQWRAACNAMTAFNRAGGKVVDGLKKRRELGDAQRIGELELCLAGL
ncbi:lysozyme [Brucella sp. MAB-22]|uniref:Lysozyme n=1 Tax=Brucella tritici TaxID=94626 RepID=A0A6L3Y668_9HYPH|nr:MULTISPECIES: lysozyme [Brucella]KAB2674862.1 lysozyme [Brucella tritici]UYT54526.1 lysozyme [Brucella sp. MAB-22]UYT57778.1 lysozyme [Brucella sp. MAB-22]